MATDTPLITQGEAGIIFDHILKGELDVAQARAEALLAREPANPLAHYLRGLIYKGQGDYNNAVLWFNQALKLKPDFKKACSDLAYVLQLAGQLPMAFKTYEYLLKIEQAEGPLAPEEPPRLSDASMKMLAEWNDKGQRFYQRGEMEQALEMFKKALAVTDYYPDLMVNMGVALWSLGRHQESEDILLRCLRGRPGHAPALNQLGNSYKERRYLSKAVAAYRLAHASAPHYRQPLLNLGKTYFELQLYAEAIDAYERTLKVEPDCVEARGENVYLRQMLCRWENLDAYRARFVEAVAGSALPAEPFVTMLYAPADLQCANARKWARKLYPGAAAWKKETPLPVDRREDGRLRIGYLSSDFQRHATLALISELFAQHDRSRFEIYAYSHGIDDGGPERARVKESVDCFRDLLHRDDKAACDLITRDGIDILIDIKGYTQSNRLGIVAKRPAPVQMHYLGFPGTLGAECIDYFIGDAVAAPAYLDPYFTERLIRLPHSYQMNDRKRPRPLQGPSRAEYGLPENAFVFCAFNNAYKITPEVFAVWMRLLAQIEGSVVWVLEAHHESTENLRREAAGQGIDPDRIIPAKTVKTAEYLARYRHADLFLDTSPVCGHTTASDALWCGVPMVALGGDSFIGRVSASLLHAVELPELVAESLQDYEALALAIARDAGRLAALRLHLEEGRMRFPLFDSLRTTRALEAAYLHAAELHRTGHAPRSFSLTPDLQVV